MSNMKNDLFKDQKHISRVDLSTLQNIASCYKAIASDIQNFCLEDLITPGEYTRSFALEAKHVLEQAHRLDDIITNIIYDYGNNAM